jgi:hypothetical protein
MLQEASGFAVFSDASMRIVGVSSTVFCFCLHLRAFTEGEVKEGWLMMCNVALRRMKGFMDKTGCPRSLSYLSLAHIILLPTTVVACLAVQKLVLWVRIPLEAQKS